MDEQVPQIEHTEIPQLEAENPNHASEELRKKLGAIQLVDMSSGVTAESIDGADRTLNEQTTQGGFRGIVKKIWHGNIARDYIRQRETRRNEQALVESGNIHLIAGGTDEESDRTKEALIHRFTDETISLRQGEENSVLDKVEGGKELQADIRGLIAEFARGDLDIDTLTEERTRVLQKFGKSLRESDRRTGLMFADNIIEVAQNAKAAFEHGVGLDNIDKALEMNLGTARMGVRSEVKRDAASRVLEKVQSTKVGSLLNETTLATAVGVATSVAKWSTRSAAGALGRTLGIGIGAGVIAGFRERLRTDQERQLHMRQMAEGADLGEAGNRRAQLEETRYRTAPVQDILKSFGDIQEQLHSQEKPDPQTIGHALNSIACIRTLIGKSDELNVDLISFSDKTRVEEERYELDLQLAILTAEVEAVVGDMSEEDRQALEFEGETIDDMLASKEELLSELIGDELSQKDAVYKKLRRSRTLKMAVAGFASGVAIGSLVQETRALLGDDLSGLFEQHADGNNRTMLAGLFRQEVSSSTPDSVVTESYSISDSSVINIPEANGLGQAADGTYGIFIKDGDIIAEGIQLEDDGSLSSAAKEVLESNGFTVSEHTEPYTEAVTTTETISATPQEFIRENPDQFQKVSRELWYDNNTASPQYEQNELRLEWGGESGSGIDSEGNYVFSVANMLQDGSVSGAESTDHAQLIESGDLKIAISLDSATQDTVYFVDIDQNGNAVIPTDSPIGQSAFESVNGKVSFNGAYAEAVQLTGEQPDGTVSMRMLATVVGSNSPSDITASVTRVIETPAVRTITDIIPPEPASDVEVAPVAPLLPREGLQKDAQEDDETETPELEGPPARPELESSPLPALETTQTPELESPTKLELEGTNTPELEGSDDLQEAQDTEAEQAENPRRVSAMVAKDGSMRLYEIDEQGKKKQIKADEYAREMGYEIGQPSDGQYQQVTLNDSDSSQTTPEDQEVTPTPIETEETTPKPEESESVSEDLRSQILSELTPLAESEDVPAEQRVKILIEAGKLHSDQSYFEQAFNVARSVSDAALKAQLLISLLDFAEEDDKD